MSQLHVAKPRLLGQLAALLDLSARAIDPDELAAGQQLGDGQQVASASAAELEHAAAGDGGGLHAEQRGDDAEVIGVGARVGVAGVRDLVVAVDQRGGGGHP